MTDGEDDLAERRRIYLEGCAETTDADTRAQAIADCRICDAHGYRGGYVCDHIDRRDIYRRGHALATQALAEAKAQRARPDKA